MDDIGFVSQSKARRSEAPHRKLNAGDLSLVMSCVILCHCQPQLFGASNANHSLPFFSSGIPSGTAAVTLKMWGEL